MTQHTSIIAAARQHLGTVGGKPFVAWYNKAMGSGIPLGSAWCAIFVSFCARQVGITTTQIPNFAGCTSGRTRFKHMKIWHDRDKHIPSPGDLVLFDWDGDPTLSEHVGIVTRQEGGYVYTIEGNSQNTVREKKYPRKSSYILGYAAWNEKKEDVDMTAEEVKKLVAHEVSNRVAQALEANTPTLYASAQDVPQWAKPTVDRLVKLGRLKGNEHGVLNLTDDLLRAFVALEPGV